MIIALRVQNLCGQNQIPLDDGDQIRSAVPCTTVVQQLMLLSHLSQIQTLHGVTRGHRPRDHLQKRTAENIVEPNYAPSNPHSSEFSAKEKIGATFFQSLCAIGQISTVEGIK